jgi:hypothetical protein
MSEVDDVGHVGPTPLVDGLVVVAHHAQFGLRAHEEPYKTLLGGVDVLVLVDYQVQEPETVAVDGTHEEPAEAVESCPAQSFLDPAGDPVAKLLGGTLGEGEGHDRLGRGRFREQVGYPLRHDLRLSRSGGCDDLDVPAPVAHGVERGTLQLWGCRGCRLRGHDDDCRTHHLAVLSAAGLLRELSDRPRLH